MATSLLDIVPRPVVITLEDGGSIEVSGVDVNGISDLLGRFPAVAAIFTDREKLDVPGLIAQAPDMAAAIVAAATGNTGKPEEEAAAKALPVGLQAEIILAALQATFPQGLNSFLARLDKALPAAGAGQGAAALRSALGTK